MAAGKAANAAQVISNPLIATLRAQESDLNRQLADLSSRYLPSHPKIEDLKAQKENFEGKIDEEIQRIVESIRNSVSVAGAHVSSLEQSLARVEGRDCRVITWNAGTTAGVDCGRFRVGHDAGGAFEEIIK